MIRVYNSDQVRNNIYKNKKQTRILLILQLLSALCALAFVGWQELAEVRMFNLFFTVAWVLLEVAVLIWELNLRRDVLGGHKVASWEAKQNIEALLQSYSRLRYAKFMGILCNFLGMVGAIKSMRFYGMMEWSSVLCLACLGLCLVWLQKMNEMQMSLADSVKVYMNFQFGISGDHDRQSYREMA